jgi:hypothetical protein
VRSVSASHWAGRWKCCSLFEPPSYKASASQPGTAIKIERREIISWANLSIYTDSFLFIISAAHFYKLLCFSKRHPEFDPLGKEISNTSMDVPYPDPGNSYLMLIGCGLIMSVVVYSIHVLYIPEQKFRKLSGQTTMASNNVFVYISISSH